MRDNRLNGIVIPVATPFDDEGNLSTIMLEDNFNKWGRTGIRGYMCLGSNGEFCSLSDEESLVIVNHALGLKRDKTLMVGVGRESLQLTLRFIEKVLSLGAGVDFISVLTPHYFASLMDDVALVDYYEAVAEYSSVPVLVYVAPSFANGVIVSAKAIKRLAEHPNIAGMKDTTPASLVNYMTSVGGRDDFTVLAGSLNNLLTCLALGGAGGVVSAANYLPNECAEITNLYIAGKREEAVGKYLRLQGLVSQTAGKYSVAGLKSCMNLCGFSGGTPRLPVRPLSSGSEDEIRDILARNSIVSA